MFKVNQRLNRDSVGLGGKKGFLPTEGVRSHHLWLDGRLRLWLSQAQQARA